MPIRVSKSAIGRSRGVPVPTSAEAGLPALGVFNVANNVANPLTAANVGQANALTLEWGGWMTGRDFMRLQGGKIVVSQGTYKIEVALQAYAPDASDISAEGAVIFDDDWQTSGARDWNELYETAVGGTVVWADSELLTVSADMILDYKAYRSAAPVAKPSLLVDGKVVVERIGDYTEFFYG